MINEGLKTLNLLTLLLAFGIVDRWIKMKTYHIYIYIYSLIINLDILLIMLLFYFL